MWRYRFTQYFENEVLKKRPYVTKELCVEVVDQPLKVERQDDDRYRFWAKPVLFDGRALRVVTLGDKTTIHNAFLDRGFSE